MVLLFCKAMLSIHQFFTVLVLKEFFFFLLIYQGDIQQLLILEDPQAAARYCVDYIPNCDSALPYSIQARREVSTVSTRR